MTNESTISLPQTDVAKDEDEKLAKTCEASEEDSELYKDENGIMRIKADKAIDRTFFCKHDTNENHTIEGTKDGAETWCQPEQLDESNVVSIEQKRDLAREIIKTFDPHCRPRRCFDLAIIGGYSEIFENVHQYRESVCRFLDNRGYEYVEVLNVKLATESFKSSLFDIRKMFLDGCFWVIDRKNVSTLREDCMRLAYEWRAGFIFKPEFESAALGIRSQNTQDQSNQTYTTEAVIEYDMFSKSSFKIFHSDMSLDYGAREILLEDIYKELRV